MMKKVITSTPKLTKMLTVNKKMYFSNRRKNNKKKFNISTSYIQCLVFSEQF